ncbi:cache domain-containing sensor histidine kinase [Paenibacillus contaminans]|uniref:histidine kinase n=1 Tax=Paenibacillus contaminans TaxID=450362 RepID=A0A329MLN4_9BACL|nr:histidine kinase [Paenibacillus contaminans]RAV20478.1 sensor histidine kinase [Paenibacillus contaminans]
MVPIKRFMPYSFKNRLTILLIVAIMVPLGLIGAVSYASIYSVLENKAERGVRSNLHQVMLSLESTLDQLNHASQQLALDGRIGKNLDRYLEADVYEKKQLHDEIKNELSLVTFTNPSMGLAFYYFADSGQVMFENYSIKKNADILKLPVLSKFGSISYNGPHLSLNPWDGHQVFSIVRTIDLSNDDSVYVYIETSFKLAESLMNMEQSAADTAHLIVDAEGRILFSEDEASFPSGSLYASGDGDRDRYAGHYFFEETNDKQSWKLVAAIPKASYDSELRSWLLQFVVLTILSLAAGCLVAWILWRSVYEPLKKLSQDMRLVPYAKPESGGQAASIMEFDRIHNSFESMRLRIEELLQEAEQREQRKARLEVEKLLHQINPHFLYNALDTVRWLARMRGQKEIDKLVSTLNKILHYNLNKGETAKIRDELEALQNYMAVQAVRFHFQYEIDIEAEERMLDWVIPRFILQPLVENAILHGLKEDGRIGIRITEEGSDALIEVRDDGIGMTEEQLRKLRDTDSEQTSSAGFGIGLNYVRKVVGLRFGENAKLTIESMPDTGTVITLRLPILQEVDGGA